MISGLAREIVLIDRNEELAKGESMDLNHGISFAHPTKIYAAGFEGCKDADIVVITAGTNQKPGQRRAAYQIIEAKGSTNYSIALTLVKITRAIVRNENSILPVSTLITDFYGISDVCISIPALVNIKGVEQYMKLNLSDQEQKLFKHSASTLKNLIKAINF